MTAANIGTVVHAHLANYYGGAVTTEADQEAWLSLSAEDQNTATKMVDTYLIEVESEGLDIGQSTMTVENRWDMEIGGITLSGQVDQVYFDELRGGHVIRDHKTVGQFFQTAPLDFQLMCYAVLARAQGVLTDIVAIEHNQIKRNKRTATAKPPYINRTWQPVTDTTIDHFTESLSCMAEDYATIFACSTGVEDPHLWAVGRNDCSFTCSFNEVCAMISSGEDYAAVLETEYIWEEPVDITP